MQQIPRLGAVKPVSGTLSLEATWDDGYRAVVDLTGVIARSSVLRKLSDPRDFARVRIVDYGSGIAWPHPDRPDDFDEDAPDRLDYASSALRDIADIQEPMDAARFASWQKRHGLTNSQAARVLDVSVRTIDNYRSGARHIPTAVKIACVSANNDPYIIEAHFRPSRAPGRPTKNEAA